MLSEKVVIVAGGGHGLGKAVSAELGALGATVVVNDLGTDVHGEGEDPEPAKQTAQEVRRRGGEAMAHFGDVSSLEYAEELCTDTADEYGRIDGVANFAGVLRDRISYKMTAEEWDSVIRVHLRGHFAVLRAVGSHWREEAGDGELDPGRSFVGLSSRSALGSVGQANYAAAKAGVLGLVRTAARELHRYGVRVNALMPSGYTRTTETIPTEQRPYEPDEFPPEKIAPMVGYLLSDAAADVTGCTFRVAGDGIGLVSDPQVRRMAYRRGGWTVEAIADVIPETLGDGEELSRTDQPF